MCTTYRSLPNDIDLVDIVISTGKKKQYSFIASSTHQDLGIIWRFPTCRTLRPPMDLWELTEYVAPSSMQPREPQHSRPSVASQRLSELESASTRMRRSEPTPAPPTTILRTWTPRQDRGLATQASGWNTGRTLAREMLCWPHRTVLVFSVS